MVRTEEEPKHPYVTRGNAKVHLCCSISIIILSVIQIILGIVISEQTVNRIVKTTNDDSENYYADYSTLFYGDHIWIGFVGIMLGILGISVWHTRARANGIVLAMMLFLSAFVIYPIAAALGGGLYHSVIRDVHDLRIGSAVYTGVQAFFLIFWAFYTSFHACCNSKVKKQTRFNIQAGDVGTQLQQQQNVVYIQPTVPYPGQHVQYVSMGQAAQYPLSGPPVQYTATGQPVQFVAPNPNSPPQYAMSTPGPIQHGQVPIQVEHGSIPGTTDHPPSYSES